MENTNNLVEFPAKGSAALCSFSVCAAGHEWPTALALAKCGGCGTQLVAIKMDMCPVCNEPAEKTKLRVDNLSQGMRVVSLCTGEASAGEVGVIEIVREYAKAAEVGTKPTQKDVADVKT